LTVLAPGYLAARHLGDWRPDPVLLSVLVVAGVAVVLCVLGLRRQSAASSAAA
jgi:hypothetical protein